MAASSSTSLRAGQPVIVPTGFGLSKDLPPAFVFNATRLLTGMAFAIRIPASFAFQPPNHRIRTMSRRTQQGRQQGNQNQGNRRGENHGNH
jgi:hypothetical protein